ncbi:DUF397 domain-containing protein [Streptomyces sp. DSM 110735]|uniref:DUF397 domain-containing protein n=1 Tax=Streptomyces sp. DSM 110735 TaxID=2775031 RepID=UPI0018F35FC6|nr:DUF397 domain-containing protein [Streptomyces sp. DSM 110735]MBJ7901812.1 DUF397 domain-containing protein [Streptomyces sp. DSM 110735]
MTSTLRWFKSSYSDSTGGQCVEAAYTWCKSSYSDSSGGHCVEVATCPHDIHVRDSKVPDGPHLTLSTTAWTSFLTGARRA